MKAPDPLPTAIRRVEVQVLDQQHLNEPLLQRDQREALIYLQRTLAHSIRDYLEATHDTDCSTTDYIASLSLGFDQAVRWVLSLCSSREAAFEPISDFMDLDDEAAQLMSWAIKYVKLCADHTAASRGSYTARIDEKSKLITFSISEEVETTSLFLGQLAVESLHSGSRNDAPPHALLDELFESWIHGADLSNVHVASDLPDIWASKEHQCYQAVRAWLDRRVLPELEETVSLGDFTLGDFRKFWTHLHIATRMMTDLETRMDRDFGIVNHFGSVILEAPTDEFSSWLAECWELDHHVTRSIIKLLTLDPKAPRDALNSSIFLQTAAGTTHLVCWKANLAEPGSVSSRALARKSKKVYDALINLVEQSRVADVSRRLEGCGLVSIVGKKLKAEETEIHPDFWLFEPLTSTLLACDYKHALPPFGPADVANRLCDLQSWFKQLRKYINFANENSAYISRALRLPKIEQTKGLILFRWPLPIPLAPPGDITLLDWPTLKSLLDTSTSIGISDLHRFSKNLRLLLPSTRGEIKFTHQDILVGDWTYRHPVIELGSSDPVHSMGETITGA